MNLLIRWGALAASFWVATALIPGIDVLGGFTTYLWVGDKEMVFCGKAKSYVNEYGDKVDAPAFTKGKYTFSAKFTVVKPKLTTTSSKDIVFTVK